MAIGSALAACGNGIAMKCHESSIDQIKLYESNMLSYIKLVDNDMKTTEKMMDLFYEAEQMLTEDIPFDKHKWKAMIKYLLNGEHDGEDEDNPYDEKEVRDEEAADPEQTSFLGNR